MEILAMVLWAVVIWLAGFVFGRGQGRRDVMKLHRHALDELARDVDAGLARLQSDMRGVREAPTRE